MNDGRTRVEPPPLPETRREEAGFPATTRREGEATGGQAAWSAPRQFELPALLLENGFGYGERLQSRGAEASLHLVLDANGRSFVLKVYHQGAPKRDILERLGAIDSRYVNPIYAYDDSPAGFWELQAWAREGSLRDLITREGPQFAPSMVEAVLRELASALFELHGQDIEHRDLKPENVLIASRQPLQLSLIDFGIASVVEGSMHATSASRTTFYAPPEAFSGIFRKECWDYWSLGIILVELLAGRHPFAGLSEQVVMHRLMTLNPDDFVAGVTDERWKLLCRGLLRRTPEKRWGGEHIERWLRRDSTLTVAGEAGTSQSGGTPSPAFLGERFQAPEDLAVKLATNWTTAVQFWKTNAAAIKHWVLHELGRKDIAERLDAIDRENVGAEGELFRVIKAFDPTIPASFRGVQIDVSGLTALVAKAAGNDNDALTMISALQKERILAAADMPGRAAEFAALEAAWRREIEAYATLAASMSGHMHNASSLALTPAGMAMLLGAALPGTPMFANLRQHAQRAASADARACRWFRDLEKGATASPGRLLLMPLLAPAAANETATERQKRSDENWRLVGQVVKYGSIPALIVVWMFYYNSPGQVAARQEEARQAEIARQHQERARQEQVRLQQEAEQQRRALQVRETCASRFRPLQEVDARNVERLNVALDGINRRIPCPIECGVWSWRDIACFRTADLMRNTEDFNRLKSQPGCEFLANTSEANKWSERAVALSNVRARLSCR